MAILYFNVYEKMWKITSKENTFVVRKFRALHAQVNQHLLLWGFQGISSNIRKQRQRYCLSFKRFSHLTEMYESVVTQLFWCLKICNIVNLELEYSVSRMCSLLFIRRRLCKKGRINIPSLIKITKDERKNI